MGQARRAMMVRLDPRTSKSRPPDMEFETTFRDFAVRRSCLSQVDLVIAVIQHGLALLYELINPFEIISSENLSEIELIEYVVLS